MTFVVAPVGQAKRIWLVGSLHCLRWRYDVNGSHWMWCGDIQDPVVRRSVETIMRNAQQEGQIHARPKNSSSGLWDSAASDAVMVDVTDNTELSTLANLVGEPTVVEMRAAKELERVDALSPVDKVHGYVVRVNAQDGSFEMHGKARTGNSGAVILLRNATSTSDDGCGTVKFTSVGVLMASPTTRSTDALRDRLRRPALGRSLDTAGKG